MSVLDGFEAVGEKTTTNKMTMTVMESSVRFSKGVTEALGCPAYVKLLVNDKQKKIAVQACDAKDENAIKFCKTKRSKADGVDSDAAGKASPVTVRTTDVLVAVQKYFTFPPVADDQIAYFAWMASPTRMRRLSFLLWPMPQRVYPASAVPAKVPIIRPKMASK